LQSLKHGYNALKGTKRWFAMKVMVAISIDERCHAFLRQIGYGVLKTQAALFLSGTSSPRSRAADWMLWAIAPVESIKVPSQSKTTRSNATSIPFLCLA
jgi:hypothetical protein